MWYGAQVSSARRRRNSQLEAGQWSRPYMHAAGAPDLEVRSWTWLVVKSPDSQINLIHGRHKSTLVVKIRR